MPNVHEIIRDHVSLSTTCVDRLYVNGYLPTLQTGGQLWFSCTIIWASRFLLLVRCWRT